MFATSFISETKTAMHFDTIIQAGNKIRRGEITASALTEMMLDRIEEQNSNLNAYVTVTMELAREQAKQADSELRKGYDRGPLHGIPIAIKDLFATEGIRTTSGSKLFENWIPDRDATVVTRLQEAGAVLLGKTGLHELANGNTSINPHFGAVHNPVSIGCDPGGSSGGSASAVAAGLAFAALGTDTACSVRQPAHCCGVVGFKPTFGLVSKHGASQLAWTLDHVGPIARNIQDCALMLDAIVGYDPKDFYSITSLTGETYQPAEISLEGLRLGVMRQYFFEGDAEIVRIVDRALTSLVQKGVVIVELEIPDVEQAFDAAMKTFAETAAVYGQALAEQPEKFSNELRDKIEWSATVSADEYLNAQAFRLDFTSRMESLLDNCDVFASPTSTRPALPIENRPPDPENFGIRNCVIFNFTGQPSVSIPCGTTVAGSPVGLMLSGHKYEDRKVIAIANACENPLR